MGKGSINFFIYNNIKINKEYDSKNPNRSKKGNK